MKKIKFTISSSMNNIDKYIESLIETIVNQFKIPNDLYGKLNLTVTEAIINSVRWGNKEDIGKKVRITAIIKKDQFIVTIEDEGLGFDYTKISDPTSPANLNKESGRGLFLIKELTDDLIFENRGAKISLIFNISLFN